jgi:hypothetical protein
MNTVLSVERKVLSSYKEVSRTFTYGIYATLPLFIVYQIVTYGIGIPLMQGGKTYRSVSDAEQFLNEIIMFFGVSQNNAPLFLVLGIITMLFLERRKFGLIQPQISFFFRTFSESVYLGFILKYAVALLVAVAIFLLSGVFPPLIFPSIPASPIEILQKTGFGFYEELLYRVILLGGLLAFFRVLRIPGTIARIVTVTSVSIIFSGVHFFGPLAYPLDIGSFLYLGYLSVLFSYIYLWRGFATAAWSHTLFDIFPSL